MKKVAVVILNWNGKELMRRFLPSVIGYSKAAEVIVADNGSTDGSLEMLRYEFPAVKTIVLEQNYGFAEGYNRAIAQLEQDIIVLLNSDVEVTPGWLDHPLDLLEKEPEIAAVQPKILSENDRTSFDYAGAAGGFIDRLGYPFCRGRVLSVIETDRGQYDTPMEVFWVSGAAMFIRREVYLKEGGLDARFFAHQEEIDLCWRLRCRGYRLVCDPRSVIYHVGGGTLDAESPRKTYLNFRNNLLMLYKNLPQKELRKVMRIRWWLDYLAAFQFIITGHYPNAKAVRKARKDFKGWKKLYISIRTENIQKTIVTTLPGQLNKSLLFEYYFKSGKTFNSIFK